MRPIAGTARRVPALNPDLGNLYWSCETPEEAAGAAASTIPAGYFGTYEPAIDMEWIKSTWQTAREAVNNKLGPATGETFEDNRWTRAMRDELGINVTYLRAQGRGEGVPVAVMMA